MNITFLYRKVSSVARTVVAAQALFAALAAGILSSMAGFIVFTADCARAEGYTFTLASEVSCELSVTLTIRGTQYAGTAFCGQPIQQQGLADGTKVRVSITSDCYNKTDNATISGKDYIMLICGDTCCAGGAGGDGKYFCPSCQSGSPTTSTTTTFSSTAYIAAINLSGNNWAATEPSGALPGESVSLRTHASGSGAAAARNMAMRTAGYAAADLPADSLRAAAWRMRAGAAESRSANIIPVEGEQKSFWVKDAADAEWRSVSATARRVGDHSVIYVDSNMFVSYSDIDVYAKEFETMYSLVSDTIGAFSDKDGSGKVALLLYAMNTDSSDISGDVAAYFSILDFLADQETMKQYQKHSNEMDMIYVRGNSPKNLAEGLDFHKEMMPAVMHAYQHLVNFSVTFWQPAVNGNAAVGMSDTWINEMMSMAMETLYFQTKLAADAAYTHSNMKGRGYLAGRIAYYSSDPEYSIRNGHGLTYWDGAGDVLANYALSYLMGQYLSIHARSGNGVFKQILTSMVLQGVYNYTAVAAVAGYEVAGILTWEELLKNWAAANILGSSTGLKGYKGGFTLAAHSPTAGQADLHSGGVVYRRVSGAWSVPSGAGANVKYYDLTNGAANSSTTTTVSDGTQTTTTTTKAPDNATTLVADFIASPASGPAPLKVTFMNLSQGPVSSYYWLFGDGDNSTAENPVHVYASPGTYSVMLQIRGADGASVRKVAQNAITVKGLAACPAKQHIDSAEELNGLRMLRGRMLASVQSLRLVALYYRHAGEINRILSDEQDLRIRFRRLVVEVMEALAHSENMGGAEVSSDIVGSGLALLYDMQAYAAPELACDLAVVAQGLADGSIPAALGIGVRQEL